MTEESITAEINAQMDSLLRTARPVPPRRERRSLRERRLRRQVRAPGARHRLQRRPQLVRRVVVRQLREVDQPGDRVLVRVLVLVE